MSQYIRYIGDVVDTLRNAKQGGWGCALLIGADCSVSAGIPAAQGFVDHIRESYPEKYGRAEPKTYSGCMAQLHPDERRQVIAKSMKSSKLNWAHIAIAQLMHHGYVDRVLTTNFDPLLVQACALLGDFPAVYDLAASTEFRPRDIPVPAILYLHGQRTGFVLLNTEDEFDRYSELLMPAIEDTGHGRAWIVAGYSGENDPVFDRLASVASYRSGLYWVVRGDKAPPAHVRERMLVDGKYAYYLNGYDADAFFISLAQALRVFPPDFVSRPFSYVDRMLNTLADFALPVQPDIRADITSVTRGWVKEAIGFFELGAPALVIAHDREPETSSRTTVNSSILEAHLHLLAGNYEAVLALREEYERTSNAELGDILTWAHMGRGGRLVNVAYRAAPDAIDKLLDRAEREYDDAYVTVQTWGDLPCIPRRLPETTYQV